MSFKRNKIVVGMMVKNEEDDILVSLNSTLPFIETLFIHDTGSTDNTLSTIQEWSRQHAIDVYLTQSKFVDFSTSRNVLLDFAEKHAYEYDFMLLLDAGDYFDDTTSAKVQSLIDTKVSESGKDVHSISVVQKWFVGNEVTKFTNTRLVSKNAKLRYVHRVHEHLTYTDSDVVEDKRQYSLDHSLSISEIVILQDRARSGESTKARLKRDVKLLLEDVAEKEHPRDMFYLAQTFMSLGDFQNAYKWYYRRLLLGNVTFKEEFYHVLLQLGESARHLRLESQAVGFFFLALSVDFRAEPLVEIAKMCVENEDYILGYIFSFISCSLNKSSTDSRILFVNTTAYDYSRWYIMALCCVKLKKHNDLAWLIENSGLPQTVTQEFRNALSGYEYKSEELHNPFRLVEEYNTIKSLCRTEEERSNTARVYASVSESTERIVRDLCRLDPESIKVQDIVRGLVTSIKAFSISLNPIWLCRVCSFMDLFAVKFFDDDVYDVFSDAFDAEALSSPSESTTMSTTRNESNESNGLFQDTLLLVSTYLQVHDKPFLVNKGFVAELYSPYILLEQRVKYFVKFKRFKEARAAIESVMATEDKTFVGKYSRGLHRIARIESAHEDGHGQS